MKMMRLNHPKRRGVSLVYSCLVLTAMLALTSLAVDWGRVTLVRVELQQAADAAALSAASNLMNKSVNQARADAVQTASQNFAHFARFTGDNDPGLRSQDVKITRSKSYLPYFDTAEVTISRPVTMAFASFIGFSSFQVDVRATARFVPEVDVDEWVRGTSNPYLSGMPEGTLASRNNPHNSPDEAGDITSSRPRDWKESPFPVRGLPIVPGQILNFDQIDGTTQHDPDQAFYSPDGETGENGISRDIGTNTAGAEHGMSNLRAPINALVGVFLGPDRPDTSGPPAMLDYSSYDSRHKERYEPKLKQLFFIGDGMANKIVDGQEVQVRQSFVVPEGATRLFLATWDFYEWNNNGGERQIEIKRPSQTFLIE